MISSEVDAAPRSLADQMSELSQRFDHENDTNHLNGGLETASHKVYKQNSAKLTPAVFKSGKLGGRFQGAESITDVNSVAMTAKPSQSFRNQYQGPSPHHMSHSKTLLYQQ